MIFVDSTIFRINFDAQSDIFSLFARVSAQYVYFVVFFCCYRFVFSFNRGRKKIRENYHEIHQQTTANKQTQRSTRDRVNKILLHNRIIPISRINCLLSTLRRIREAFTYTHIIKNEADQRSERKCQQQKQRRRRWTKQNTREEKQNVKKENRRRRKKLWKRRRLRSFWLILCALLLSGSV